MAMCVLCLCHSVYAAQYSGHVVGWGVNVSGQAMGNPPVLLPNGEGIRYAAGNVVVSGHELTNAIAIAAGDSTSVVLLSDGTVASTGWNYKGKAIGVETPAMDHTNGPVVSAGKVLNNVIAIATSHAFSLALRRDGTLVTWGENYIPSGLTNIIAIAAKSGSSWVLRRDGTIAKWSSEPSSDDYGKLHEVAGLTNIVAIAIDPELNYTQVYALERDGTVRSWGTESVYKADAVPTGLSNVIAIAAGPGYALALKRDGTVMGWGYNQRGSATGIPTERKPYVTNDLVRINGLVVSNVVAIAANWGEGMQDYSMALKSDGTVIGWGPAFPTPPAGLSNVVAISAGEGYCLAITTNNAVADRSNIRR